jgi:hypothetical protein
VAGSSDKEGETGVCELGIKYPILQAIYAGELNRQSIQVISMNDIIYDLIVCYMISYLILHKISGAGQKNICWKEDQ